MTNRIFINRRTGKDRRQGLEQRKNPRLDLTSRRRRTVIERRQDNRELSGDFYASEQLVNEENIYLKRNKH